MNQGHDLEQLWKSQPIDKVVKGEEMLMIIVNKTRSFDRRIRRRNLREMIAAAIVAIAFLGIASVQRNGLERAGSVLIAASAVWIMYYLRRYGSEPPEPEPAQAVAAYQHALIRKYDHQIRLLRNVKLWYLLPMYLGLLLGWAGMIKQRIGTGPLRFDYVLFPLLFTLIFVGIWWLNEVYGVRKLRRMRTEILSQMGEE